MSLQDAIESELEDKIKQLQSQLATANEENGRLWGNTVGLVVCVADIAQGVFRLWHAVADGTYDSRSIVGDATLNMQESLLEIGIDVRIAPLNIEALKGEMNDEKRLAANNSVG